jgi:hypothetical protein
VVDVPVFVAPELPGNGRNGSPFYRHTFWADDLIPEPKPVVLPKETPYQRAHRFQTMLDTGLVTNRAELARALGCSRAWVTRVLGARP